MNLGGSPDPAGLGELGAWILQAVPDGLWVVDDDGLTTYGNGCLAELLGLDPEEVVGFPLARAFDEEGRERLRGRLREPFDDAGRGDDIECRLVRRDGSTFWARVSHVALRDESGERRGWLLRVRDNTEQRRLVEDLRRGELKLAEAQSIAGMGSWEIDVAGDGELHWSDELYRVLEVDPATFVPTPDSFRQRLHPDDRLDSREAADRMMAGEDALDVDVRLDRAPGLPTRWVRVRGRVTRAEDGSVLRLGGTVQDVTETKAHEQGLAFLSAMAGAANEARTLPEALLAADEVVRPHTQWPAVQVSFPISGSGELQHFDSGWHDVGPEDVTAARALAARAVEAAALVSEPGPRGTYLVSGPVVHAGRVVCVVTSDSRSMLPPRTSELAIFRQMLNLLAHVCEREESANELARARDAAVEASRAKSEFLATMSHEIRTPLNGVIGLSELLGRTELSSHQRRLAEGVDQAGRALLALVNDILDLSKIEAGRLDLEEVDFDPRQVLEQSVSLLAERASARGLELVVGSAGSSPSLVRGDPVRFGQVITNLVANAVKFTHEGEVVVRVTGTGGADLRVEVTDTGIGIEPDVQARLFDAFSQADSSTTREYGGTGLGLAISERIVAALGGRIGVRSEPGVGSTFWFTAAFAEPSGAGAPEEPIPAAAVEDLRVLVVDDNETNRFILAEQLSAWGVKTETVASAYDALVELDTAVRGGSPYDVALLDYMMPGMDGEQLARTIRCEERYTELRLALLSSGVEPTAEWLASAGIDSYLGKPVFPSRLLDTLATLVGRVQPVAPPEADPAVEEGSRGRVLVVEDNPVNQLVAEGILRRLGYDLRLADNGAVGIEMLAGDPRGFDVVLMDCQMPVMDGFDATRAIRAMPGDVGRVPIVAMTAAATEAERERCREAGMDDFLSKPVVPALLEASLERWAHSGDADTRLRTLVEDDGIDLELVQLMVSRFGASAPRAVAELDDAVATEDPVAVVRIAHGLRGSAANLGLTRLAALAAELEETAREGRVPHAAALTGLRVATIEAVDELGRAARRLRGPE
jgi:PAS domain S-box-containing protein